MPFSKGKGFGDSGGGGFVFKTILVPADFPTIVEADANLNVIYVCGTDPSVIDNDPTKTNTGKTIFFTKKYVWDVSTQQYYEVGGDDLWLDDGTDYKTISPRNIDMQGKGLKNTNLWTTVGEATLNADYNDINTAIAAGKYNLLIIGNFTQPTNINTGSNFVQIHIIERLTITGDVNFTIGTGGIRIRGAILQTTFNATTTDLFVGTGTLDIADVSFFDNSTIGAIKLGNLTSGTKHIIHNCKFALPNNDSCGFHGAGNGSSFTTLNVIGGGSSCNGLILSADNVIIDDINISGTWDPTRQFISSSVGSNSRFILNNMTSSSSDELLIFLTGDSSQISNLRGKLSLNFQGASKCNVANCDIENLNFNMGYTHENNFFVNVKTAGTNLITVYGNNNQFVNFNCVASFTLLAIVSTNNKLLLCTVAGTYTDNGTGNSFITNVSGDETLSADSRRLLCDQKAIKAYADNIAKGITVDYYFSNTPDGVIANYDIMFPADTGEAQSTAAAAIPAADTLIQTFITQTTEPNFTTLLAGIYDIHIHAAKTAGTKDAFIYAEFYKRTHPGGVETLLATSDNSALLTGSNVGYTLHFSLLNDEILDATDRLVVKFYGSPTGVGTDPTATLYLEGTNSSRIDIHTTSSSWMLNLQNIIYVNGAGNDANAGKNMGTPKLTIAAALTAAALQTPSSSNIITVKVLGGLRYAENVTVPSWVILDMSDAISNGQITVGVTMGTDSWYYFNEAISPTGSQAVRCSGSGNRYIKGNFTTPETSSTFLTADGGATVYLDVANANAVKTGAKFYAITTGTHLYLNASRFEETVASTSDAASNVVARIGERVAAGYTDNINHAGDFIFRGLASTGYVGFGGTVSTTYPRTKRMHYSSTLAPAGNSVTISAAALGISSALQIVNARVWGWYPAASAWMPDANIWGEGINFRIGSTGVQIQTPAGSTGMAGQVFHLVYEYQQTNFLI